jgi:hypothetical protein
MARYVSNLNVANFNNCIIYGSNQNELFLDKKTDAGVTFNYKFNHCLIKYNNTNNNALYLPTNTTDFVGCYAANNSIIYNPKFKNIAANKLWLSEAWNTTLINDPAYSNLNDIVNNPRTGTIAMGAYQFVP